MDIGQKQPLDSPEPQPQNDDSFEAADMARLAVDIQKIEDHTTEPLPSVQPIATQASPLIQSNPLAVAIVEPKQSKKTWIVAAIVSLIVITFSTGGWAAYALWYQNPDTIIGDTLFKTVFAKTTTVDGSIEVSDKNSTIATLGINGQGGYKEGVSGRVSASFKYGDATTLKIAADSIRTNNGDYYVRLTGLKDLYTNALLSLTEQAAKNKASDDQTQQITTAISALVGPYIQKLDNQWVRFAASDVSDVDKKLGQEYDCMNKVMTDATKDENRSQIKEIGDLYQKYKIIVYDKSLGTKNGNIGLLVHIDQRALEQFGRQLENTKIVKALNACSGSKSSETTTPTETSQPQKNPQQMELWVDQWSHELKRFYTKVEQGTGDEKISIVADFSFTSNQPVSITAPNDSKKIDELFPELKSQLGAFTAQSI